MLLEAAPFIGFTRGAVVACCARFKRWEDGEAIQFQRKRWPMSCNPEALKHVPLLALLDQEETAVLAARVVLKNFSPRQRIYKMGDTGGAPYAVVSAKDRGSTIHE